MSAVRFIRVKSVLNALKLYPNPLELASNVLAFAFNVLACVSNVSAGIVGGTAKANQWLLARCIGETRAAQRRMHVYLGVALDARSAALVQRYRMDVEHR
jgi:hypothetical protein